MPNPFRSEADAYRFLLLTIAYFAAIVVASLAIGEWAGLIVFSTLSLAALVWLLRRRREPPGPRTMPASRGADDERRILVIANETVGGEALREELRRRAEGFSERVLVVSPALNSPLKHWLSDEDGARVAAQERLKASLDRLRAAGIAAEGEVGDSEPLQAIEDALRTFAPHEIIISTHPEGRSHWLEKGVVSSARERFGCPITHVVVDLEAERDEIQ